MATAQITLRGRFPAGTVVRLVKVDSPVALRSEGGEEVDVQTVSDDGEVTFSKGVKEGESYFAVGVLPSGPLEVRLKGRAADDPNTVMAQPPVLPDRVRLSDGTWADETPKQVKKSDLPTFEAAPNLSQQQVGDSVPQRSSTPRGTAHPFDPKEPAPYEAQEEIGENVKQMSDTPTGRATRIAVGPQRQEDVPKGTPQRSDTPTGVATPVPTGGPVEAQKEKESSLAKEMRGEPVRAAAEPIDPSKPVRGASEKRSDARQEEATEDLRKAAESSPTLTGPDENADTRGLDAEGQPADEGVARGAGIEPAKKPAEPIRARRSSKKK